MTSPKVTVEITLGNILSIIGTLATGVGCVWYMSGTVQELKSRDLLHESRLDRLESETTRNRADHDLLIEIRQDLKMLRGQWETQPKSPSSRMP